MPVQMIVTDLDSTLLPKDKKLTAYTKQIITRAREKGILFVVATARPVRAAALLMPRDMYDAGIYHNGAVIWDETHRIGGVGIEKPVAVIHKLLEQVSDAKIAAECNDTLYCNFDSSEVWPDSEYIFTHDFQELSGLVADKLIVVTSDPEVIETCALCLPPELYIQSGEGTIGMIMNRGATKLEGIRILADIYRVPMESIAAFGDDYNDIEMLRACGTGVAVGNALPEVKQAADEMTADCEHNGVATWIEKHILS